MDEVEARGILDRRVAGLRQVSYANLKARWLGQADCEQIRGDSGAEYQVEIEAIWDDRKTEHLRLIVAIDDGGWSPITDSFIVAPNGSFIGE